MRFQSTPSGRKATSNAVLWKVEIRVSIHAFREEGDPRRAAILLAVLIVSIHAFREEGDVRCAFQGIASASVSIHAFREEGDVAHGGRSPSTTGFNPRLPGGRRHVTVNESPMVLPFQSTPSGRKATPVVRCVVDPAYVSIHAFREEGDVPDRRMRTGDCRFNPRLPGGRRR